MRAECPSQPWREPRRRRGAKSRADCDAALRKNSRDRAGQQPPCWSCEFPSLFGNRRRLSQFRVMHNFDKPRAVRLLGHHPVQQAFPTRLRTAILKCGSSHLPIHVNGSQLRRDKSNAADLRCLMAVLEDSGEDSRMKRIHVGPASRMHPRNVCEIGVFSERHGKGVCVMLVPRIAEALHRLLDGGSVFGVVIRGLTLIHCGPPGKKEYCKHRDQNLCPSHQGFPFGSAPRTGAGGFELRVSAPVEGNRGVIDSQAGAERRSYLAVIPTLMHHEFGALPPASKIEESPVPSRIDDSVLEKAEGHETAIGTPPAAIDRAA